MNSRQRLWVMTLSAVLVLSGAMLYFTKWFYAPYLFAVGSAGITVSYMTTPYENLNVRLRRLHRMNIFAGIALVAASVFMFKERTEWVVFVLISAILQLYASFAETNEQNKG